MTKKHNDFKAGVLRDMRIGVLTGGGDCPGLNAVIRGVVRKGVKEYGYEFIGFKDGWRGVLEGLTMKLDIAATRGILPRGGTILGSSRTNPFKIENGVEKIKENLAKMKVDALIVIGGEDTLGVASKLDSHHRALIVEVMGRHAGWIALHSGLAGGASCILIPEVKFSLEQVCKWVESRFKQSYAPIIVIAEGAIPKDGDLITKDKTLDSFGHVKLSGIGEWLANQIEEKTGKEARTSVLGHIQRGGSPTAFDRVLATRFGLHAITAVHDGDWGTMVALHGTKIERVPLASAIEKLKTVDLALYKEAEIFFG